MSIKLRRGFPIVSLLVFSAFSLEVAGAEYWVTKSGSDSRGCTNSTTDACLTIQKGVSLLTAGDTLNVKAGTYSDDGGKSSYVGSNFCGWLSSIPPSSNVCITRSGTLSSPITIQAAPGDEGSVIIDAQNARVGIHLLSSDYVRIRGFKIINARVQGIASWGQPENAVADESRLSIGVVIENNTIFNTHAPWGENTSAIGMWGSKNWIVRNNLLDTVVVDGGGTMACGIQSYGVINALIENNKILNVDLGIFWKDHFIQDIGARTPVFESEIRYNEISARNRGINVGIMGAGSEEGGDNYFHHNIIYGFGGEGAGIHVALAGAHSIGGKVKAENNLLDGNGASGAFGISVDSSRELRMSGNIILRTDLDVELVDYSGGSDKTAHLAYSDYNIFDSSFQIIADRYGSSGSKNFTSLSSWQGSLLGSLLSLLVATPDARSKSVDYRMIVTSADSRNYRYISTSAAKGMMSDGSNAGPYQRGTETVGLLPSFPYYSSTRVPSTPTILSVQ